MSTTTSENPPDGWKADVIRRLDALTALVGRVVAQQGPAAAPAHLTVAEAARRLGVTPPVVRQWCTRGHIRARKCGPPGRPDRQKAWRIPAAEVERLLGEPERVQNVDEVPRLP